MQHQKSSILALVALVTIVTATNEKRQTISVNGSQLPSCPGVIHAEASSTVCCVGGSLSIADPSLSSCAGWPICTGPVTISSSSTLEDPPLTCATVIDLNNPSYASILASVTASLSASGTSAETTINPTGAAATPGSSVSGSSSASVTVSSSRASTSSASTASASAASSSAANAAPAVGLSHSSLGGMVMAGLIGAAGAFF